MSNLVARLLAWLLPGTIGEEARGDLEAELAERRIRHGGSIADLWYASLVLRPSTWSLARELRRRRGSEPPLEPSRASKARGLGISWIDVKLGVRMLTKYPVMTLVSGLAISVTIAVAIGTFSVFRDFLLRPTLPLPEGERIVSFGLLNTEIGRSDWRLLHDFEVWRDELQTVESLAIWRGEARNVVSADGRVEPVAVAMMSAAGFEIARVPPILGRPLLASDEVDGAEPVVVIGHREWMARFGGAPDVLGRQLQLGRERYTIVGVMPEGFTFPVSERFWVPFTDDPDVFSLLGGSSSYVFGRLAPGATMAEVRAELDVISTRRAAELPETHANLVGTVMSYTDPHTGMDNAGDGNLLAGVVLAVLTLVVLIPFANVAILVYARTATRTAEIGVRTALGASRRRVVAQLFAEAFVLASVSAAAGVGIALLALGRVEWFWETYLRESLPFWVKAGHDPMAMVYVVGLTVLCAIVAGIIPGLRATGRNVQANLRAAGNGMRLGRVWTTLVVTQVAITVAFLPIAASLARSALEIGAAQPTFAEGEYLSAGVRVADSPPVVRWIDSARVRTADELVRRLEADPRVAGVALSTRVPGAPYSYNARVEVEGIDSPLAVEGFRVATSSISPNFFDVLGQPIVRGRAFDAADLEAEAPPAIVDEAFVRAVLGGANPIGMRIRTYPRVNAEPAPWTEIVAVAPSLVDNPVNGQQVNGMVYFPFGWAGASGARIVVHAPASASDVAEDLPRIAASIDPTMTVAGSVMGFWSDPFRIAMLGMALVVALVLTSVLLLCSAGVFALMSFNVTQRRREIGIRIALGASPRSVLARVMLKSARQLGLGVATGAVLVALTPDVNLDGLLVDIDGRIIAVVATVLVAVGLLAAAGPTREGLRVHPTEALKDA